MYVLWLVSYFAFVPLAYFGWLGLFGPMAKKAADDFWEMVSWVVVGFGILLMMDIFISVVAAIIQMLFP